MATKNIKVVIQTPSYEGAKKLTFTSLTSADVAQIPYRYPYVDVIGNDSFRAGNTDVTTKYGGLNAADSNSAIGYQLPTTEKLILLLKVKSTDAIKLKFSSSSRINHEPRVVDIAAGAVGDIIAVDIFDLGLFIQGDKKNGCATITPDKAVDLCLIARH